MIHPVKCIGCALFKSEYSADAIFAEDELPNDQEKFLRINAELAEEWPNITEMKAGLKNAARWEDALNKCDQKLGEWPGGSRGHSPDSVRERAASSRPF